MVPLSRGAGDLNRVFRPGGFVPAPDGTEVDAFLNPADARTARLPGMPEGVGLAAGRIGPGVTSAIHVHPVVTQVTYVVAGELTVRMRESEGVAPLECAVGPGEAVVAEPGMPIQFANRTETAVHVLYVTSPAYVTSDEDGYDDAILLDDWSASLSDEDLRRAAARRIGVLHGRRR